MICLQLFINGPDIAHTVRKHQRPSAGQVRVAASKTMGMTQRKRNEFHIPLPHFGSLTDIFCQRFIVGVRNLDSFRFAGRSRGIEDLRCQRHFRHNKAVRYNRTLSSRKKSIKRDLRTAQFTELFPNIQHRFRILGH